MMNSFDSDTDSDPIMIVVAELQYILIIVQMSHLYVIQHLRGRLYGPLREAFGQAVEISSMQITTLLW